jgi:hypothetical protein
MASVFRYPYEAITDTTDYLQITVKSYEGTSSLVESTTFGTSGAAASAGSPAKIGVASVGDIIILPMPSNISDSNSVGYGEDKLDILGAAAGSIAKEVMKSGGEFGNEATGGVTGYIDREFRRLLKPAGGGPALAGVALDAFTRQLAASAAGIIGANVTAEQLLTRSTGQILNPNMELLFSGPTLRQFQFQFKLTPRDQNESYQIKSIIRSFKTNMAPKIEGAETSSGREKAFVGQAFLKTPNIFELHYRKGNRNHPFLNRFKQCALKDMSVNYTGENVYATYADATPISMIMSLTFQELVPIYASDYGTDVKKAEDLLYGENKDTAGVGY